MEKNEEEAAHRGDEQNQSGETHQPGLPIGSQRANDVAERQQNEEADERWWQAIRRRCQRARPWFLDFKFSTLTQFVFSFVLIGVGYLQYTVYRKQEADSRIFQRAFVNVPDMSAEQITRDIEGKPTKVWRFSPKFANDGNTPTSDMRYIAGIRSYFDSTQGRASPTVMMAAVMHFKWVAVTGNPPNRIQFPDDPDTLVRTHKRRVFTFLGAHGTRQVSSVEIPEDAFEWSVQHGWRTFFYGEITYRDVFDQSIEHLAKFCFLLTGEDLGNGFQARTSLCDYWNCADEECKNNKRRYDADVMKDERDHASEAPLPTNGPSIEFE